MYVEPAGAWIAPLNFTGPENPDCIAGEAVQVYDCWLELDVDVPEDEVEGLLVIAVVLE